MMTAWRFTDYFYIYCLKDLEGSVFYVGKTYSIYARMNLHRRKFGKDFTYHVLDKTKDWDEAFVVEKKFIDKYLSLGFNLKNAKTGAKKKEIHP
jgi:predicted GIY-YIG superfamily endonuclease